MAAGAAALLFVVPHNVSGDGRIRYEALVQFLEHGKVVPTAYSLVGPLFSIPLYYLGKLALGPVWWCSRFNALWLIAGLALTAALLRQAAGRRLLQAFCLVILAASMFPGHVLDYFGEVFTAVLVLVGIAALAADRPALGWSSLVIGVVNTPATIVGLLLVSLRQVMANRRVGHLLPVLVAVLLVMLESWVRRGGPLVTGYEGNAGARTVMPYSGLPGFSYPIFFGALSILFSFGKGLLFFAPGLLLAPDCARRQAGPVRDWCEGLVWFLAGLVVVYAKWWSWYGGSFWGPRFFLIASVPASLAIAVAIQRRRELSTGAVVAVLGILSLSAWVGINGPVFNQGNLRLCSENHYALEFLCWYTPEFSVLWRPFVTPPTSFTWQQVTFVTYCALVYLWLAAPVVADLGTRIGRSFSTLRASAGAWRF